MSSPDTDMNLMKVNRRKREPKPIPQDAWALLDAPAVQRLCGISRTTLWRWGQTGVFPLPDKILPGTRKAWKRSTVEAWLDSQDAPRQAA